MAGHRSAGLSEFGFNALGIHPLVVRLPRHSPSLRVLLCECKRAFTENGKEWVTSISCSWRETLPTHSMRMRPANVSFIG